MCWRRHSDPATASRLAVSQSLAEQGRLVPMAAEPVAPMQRGPVVARASLPPQETQLKPLALYRSLQRPDELVVRLPLRPPLEWQAPVRRPLLGACSAALLRALGLLALDRAVTFGESPLPSQRIWNKLRSFRLLSQCLPERRAKQEKSDSENCSETFR